MFAIAFDLTVKEAERHHPTGVTQAYEDIKKVLLRHGFVWKQGSLYTNADENLAVLFAAIAELKALPWFPATVRDIRAFRVEQWSDFTSLVKTGTP